jgi:hypothetical protein
MAIAAAAVGDKSTGVFFVTAPVLVAIVLAGEHGALLVRRLDAVRSVLVHAST